MRTSSEGVPRRAGFVTLADPWWREARQKETRGGATKGQELGATAFCIHALWQSVRSGVCRSDPRRVGVRCGCPLRRRTDPKKRRLLPSYHTNTAPCPVRLGPLCSLSHSPLDSLTLCHSQRLACDDIFDNQPLIKSPQLSRLLRIRALLRLAYHVTIFGRNIINSLVLFSLMSFKIRASEHLVLLRPVEYLPLCCRLA
jgi:hypothetical protein